ncbi:MAG: phosphatidylcholine/phosphatidylserine synthase [Sphingomonadales bacterium]|nr:phosphatidylcholine/phosphatidylserine synthase [Sphingomonadales bacterium]
MHGGPETERLQGLSLRALAPNMVTAMALCVGLSGFWFASQERWPAALAAIALAAVLDGLDGRIARMVNGQSRFGAELDSLSDVISFGVTPALVAFLWTLQDMPRFGWTIALFFVLCQALRLARFNARIDTKDQPHKSAGFNTGVPAPAGAGMALLPLLIWVETDAPMVRDYWIAAPWMLFVALMMVSNVATYSWTSIRIRPAYRFPALAIAGLYIALLIAEPWIGLILFISCYSLTIPFSMISYARVKKRRAEAKAQSS